MNNLSLARSVRKQRPTFIKSDSKMEIFYDLAGRYRHSYRYLENIGRVKYLGTGQTLSDNRGAISERDDLKHFFRVL